MHILKMENYCDQNDNQTCLYTIIDSANNVVSQQRAQYMGSAQKYLEQHFSKNINIISGEGTIFSSTQIKFLVA